jgi:MoaA/NifB/PqqE/SkfB family radical SAM enzyme
MNVIRKIENVTMMVNTKAANEVFFEEEFIAERKIINLNLSPTEICELVAKDKYIPMIMSWELLDKCSFKCPFCYIVGHSRNGVVRFSEMESEIKKLIDKGLFYCLLTGGEATLHTVFYEIYKFLKTNGVLVEIYTNGSLINDSMIELFKEFLPYKVEVSVYGMTQDVFSENVGSNKFDFSLILTNILKLKNNGINVVCKTPLNKLTERQFEDIRNWCKKNEIEHYYSTAIYKGYDGENLDDFSSSQKLQGKYDALKFLNLENDFPDDENIKQRNPKGKTCYTCAIRKFGLHINSAFELTPCSETHFEESKSKLLDVGVEAALKKYRAFVDPFIGRSIVGCDGCEASKVCNMCSAKASPMTDESGKIIDFKVPEGHCNTQRQRVKEMFDYIQNEE